VDKSNAGLPQIAIQPTIVATGPNTAKAIFSIEMDLPNEQAIELAKRNVDGWAQVFLILFEQTLHGIDMRVNPEKAGVY
jgi:hypothetical protein